MLKPLLWAALASATLSWTTGAADAPAKTDETATADASKASDDDFYIAPKSMIVIRQSGVVTPAGDATGKPAVIVYDKNTLNIAPRAQQAPAEQKPAAEAPKQQAPAQPANDPAKNPAKPADDSARSVDPRGYRVPVLRLPIMFPSTSITSAGGPDGRMQVTSDAQLETREIIAPLPLGATFWRPQYTTRVPYAYGTGSGYTPPQPAQPKK